MKNKSFFSIKNFAIVFGIIVILFIIFQLFNKENFIHEAKIQPDGSTHIKINQHGDFFTIAKLNDKKVKVHIDTGATSVSINKSTANEIGIKLLESDFTIEIHSAHGTIFAAETIIKNVQIGGIDVQNLQAAILPDSALKFPLFGYGFLGKINSFEETPKELILR